MATTYIEARATLNDMAERVNNDRKRALQARAQYGTAAGVLAGMPTQYGAFITDLNDAAAAESWPQAVEQKAAKDQIVTEFNALKAEIDATIAAIDAA